MELIFFVIIVKGVAQHPVAMVLSRSWMKRLQKHHPGESSR